MSEVIIQEVEVGLIQDRLRCVSRVLVSLCLEAACSTFIFVLVRIPRQGSEFVAKSGDVLHCMAIDLSVY